MQIVMRCGTECDVVSCQESFGMCDFLDVAASHVSKG
jgi:hypothetical protein